MDPSSYYWMTKPTDRFILRQVKLHASAKLTRQIARYYWIQPWMVTLASTFLGVLGGVFFALGFGFLGGILLLFSQVLDGSDGQLARLKGKESPQGAFLDSVLDRYADGAAVIGLCVGIARTNPLIPPWALVCLGAFALIGSGLISYTTARAEVLGLRLGKPTLASKGTRFIAMGLAGLLSFFSQDFLLLVLTYLALHTQLVVLYRILRTHSGAVNDGGSLEDTSGETDPCKKIP